MNEHNENEDESYPDPTPDTPDYKTQLVRYKHTIPVKDKLMGIDIDKAKAMITKFNAFKKALLHPEKDYYRKQIKKSGWRKLASGMEITVDILQDQHGHPIKEIRYNHKDEPIITIWAKAWPAGYPEFYTVANGTWDATEKHYRTKDTGKQDQRGFTITERYRFCPLDCDWQIHYPQGEAYGESVATTRGKNRATSDLIGGGEVSAEETSLDAIDKPQKKYDF